ncbi:MAG: DNA starvation/stationary phase protection protein [Candidatus Phytoplasma sp.]|nr:DNA starvation/stationary phase protection protein [Phytoplasma sp.]
MEKLYSALNKQVANLSVFFTKLHHYHWYVKGSGFFTLHEKFEELYDEINELYDEFAERLIIIGGKPISNLKGYLQATSLKEADEEKCNDMVLAVVNDFKIMNDELKALLVLAQDLGDEVTADLAIATMTSFEKHIWMFSAYLG